MPHHFDACRGKEHEWNQLDLRGSMTLHVRGHVIDSIYTVLEHKCEVNTYFKASLRQVLKLDDFARLLSGELDRAKLYEDTSKPPCRPIRDPKFYPRREYDDIPATALRTILADGSFGLVQPIEHSMSELLRVYRTEGDKLLEPQNAGDGILHRYIRDTGSVAEGKRPFLTHHLDVGLGYSNIRKGDLVVILYGSKAPCVLRRKSHQSMEYRFMGQCYLDRWMYGDNPRRYRWWEKDAKIFALI
jgi:hypothetical protein